MCTLPAGQQLSFAHLDAAKCLQAGDEVQSILGSRGHGSLHVRKGLCLGRSCFPVQLRRALLAAEAELGALT